jgi:hypothetical protein
MVMTSSGLRRPGGAIGRVPHAAVRARELRALDIVNFFHFFQLGE